MMTEWKNNKLNKIMVELREEKSDRTRVGTEKCHITSDMEVFVERISLEFHE